MLLAHLSWRLKWAFLIILSVRLSVTFYIFIFSTTLLPGPLFFFLFEFFFLSDLNKMFYLCAGCPMKLVYFVSPYDLLNKRTRSPHPMTVEGMCCSCIEWHLATHILFCSKKKRIGCKSSLFMQILLWQMSVIRNFVFVVKKQCLENSWLWKLLGEKCQYLGEISSCPF